MRRLGDTTAGCPFKSFAVPANRVRVTYTMGDGFDDRPERGIPHLCQAVVHPEALATGVHQSRLSKIGEVTRCGGLGDVERFMNVTDAHLTADQQRKNP